MSDSLISMRAVRREFAMGASIVHALDGIELDIARGELVALMGPSGCGKSTLLNVLGLLDSPTSGSYELDGRDTTKLSESERVELRRHRIGFVFQSFHLVGRMTALANVELPMIFAGVSKRERRERSRATLASVGLEKRGEHKPNELSGGERQRVAIARALVQQPPILLADEPTGNLDSASGAEIVRLLEGLNRTGQTIVLVTHSLEVAKIAHRVLEMRDGKFR